MMSICIVPEHDVACGGSRVCPFGNTFPMCAQMQIAEIHALLFVGDGNVGAEGGHTLLVGCHGETGEGRRPVDHGRIGKGERILVAHAKWQATWYTTITTTRANAGLNCPDFE